jgi:hypothetical protein
MTDKNKKLSEAENKLLSTYLPPYCVSKTLADNKIIIISRGRTGYALAPIGHKESREHWLNWNEDKGITNRQILAMEIGSMFGFNIDTTRQILNHERDLKPFSIL